MVNEKSKTEIYMYVFGAPWCGNCKRLHPILQKMIEDEQLTDNILIASDKCKFINIDDVPEDKTDDITMLPTVYVFDASTDDKICSFVGYHDKRWISNFISEFLSNEEENDK